MAIEDKAKKLAMQLEKLSAQFTREAGEIDDSFDRGQKRGTAGGFDLAAQWIRQDILGETNAH